jgi:hypothetical protein
MSDGSAQTRKPRRIYKVLGVVLLTVVAIPAAAIPMSSAVAAELEQDGFSSVEVERTGAFSFTFTAKKGADDCWGSVTKMPGTFRVGQVCLSPEQ